MHRDLKAENIMLSSSDLSDIKIIDFGLARVLSQSEKATESFGTLVYSAPEILLNIPYKMEVDVWSFGVLIYYLLTGYFPFDGDNLSLKDISHKICKEDLTLPNNISKNSNLTNLICNCLKKNTLDRININQVLNLLCSM